MTHVSSYHGGSDSARRNHSLSESLPTQDTRNRDGQQPRSHSVDDALPCVTSHGAGGIACPYLLDVNHGDDKYRSGRTNDLGEPLGAITSTRGKGLAVPFAMSSLGGGVARSTDRPIPTLTASGGCNIAIPFLSTFYGNGGCSRVDCPVPTLTTKDRVCPQLGTLCGEPPAVGNSTSAMRSLLKTMAEFGVGDIGFRMMVNRELALAQGFDAGYIFAGNQGEVTRQIGNSVSPPQAAAITTTIAAA